MTVRSLVSVAVSQLASSWVLPIFLALLGKLLVLPSPSLYGKPDYDASWYFDWMVRILCVNSCCFERLSQGPSWVLHDRPRASP